MNVATSIIITLLSTAVIFVLLYILLMPSSLQVPKREERICPRCKHQNYKMVGASNSGVGLILGIGNPHYLCNNCGFRGVFPIIDEDQRIIKQKPPKEL
ncbi:zinc ribbon domain-containing protein [Candidatus Woesearchaeota archaeon]|nr:zinc ribbon domain-containing protein [Candidatus Woesearchaeota archaeon]